MTVAVLTNYNITKLTQRFNRFTKSLQLIDSEKDAMEIIEEAKRHFGVSGQELRRMRKGDLTRAAVAWRIFHETTVPQAWIAEQLNRKNAPNVCRQIRVCKEAEPSSLTKKMK